MGEERGAPAARQPSSMRRNELLRTSSRFLVEKNRAKAPERAGLGCWGALCLSPASIRPHRAWPGLALLIMCLVHMFAAKERTLVEIFKARLDLVLGSLI